MTWHIHIKFHDNRSRNWSNIKVYIKNVRDYSVGTTDERNFLNTHQDGLRWCNIHTQFHDERFRHSSNTKGVTLTVWEAIVLMLLIRKIYEVPHSGMIYIYIPCFMRIRKGAQAMLRFCSRNLRSCNVGITDLNDLWSAPFWWTSMAWYTHQVLWRLLQVFRQYSGVASKIERQ
jgi:hypothetical protein